MAKKIQNIAKESVEIVKKLEGGKKPEIPQEMKDLLDADSVDGMMGLMQQLAGIDIDDFMNKLCDFLEAVTEVQDKQNKALIAISKQHKIITLKLDMLFKRKKDG